MFVKERGHSREHAQSCKIVRVYVWVCVSERERAKRGREGWRGRESKRERDTLTHTESARERESERERECV